MSLRILEPDGKIIHVMLDGRLGAEEVGTIQPRIHKEVVLKGRPVIFDLSKVTFLASVGIRMLVETAKHLKAGGSALVVIHPGPQVERSLKIAGFDSVVGVYHDEQEALAALQGR